MIPTPPFKFQVIPNSSLTKSSAINQTVSLDLNVCQYTRTSSVRYHVTEYDEETTFWCEDASNTNCGQGMTSSNVIIRLSMEYLLICFASSNFHL